jgi:hypothetical protein
LRALSECHQQQPAAASQLFDVGRFRWVWKNTHQVEMWLIKWPRKKKDWQECVDLSTTVRGIQV